MKYMEEKAENQLSCIYDYISYYHVSQIIYAIPHSMDTFKFNKYCQV